jgi:hypothetical protein
VRPRAAGPPVAGSTGNPALVASRSSAVVGDSSITTLLLVLVLALGLAVALAVLLLDTAVACGRLAGGTLDRSRVAVAGIGLATGAVALVLLLAAG